MEFIQHNILTILLAIVSLGGFIFLSLKNDAGKKSLNPVQATLLVNRENATVIDLRNSDDYVVGHVPESRNIPEAHLEERLPELLKLVNSPLILVCQSGKRAAAVLQRLEKQGFDKARVLDGGISAWVADGMPLKKGAKK